MNELERCFFDACVSRTCGNRIKGSFDGRIDSFDACTQAVIKLVDRILVWAIEYLLSELAAELCFEPPLEYGKFIGQPVKKALCAIK